MYDQTLYLEDDNLINTSHHCNRGFAIYSPRYYSHLQDSIGAYTQNISNQTASIDNIGHSKNMSKNYSVIFGNLFASVFKQFDNGIPKSFIVNRDLRNQLKFELQLQCLNFLSTYTTSHRYGLDIGQGHTTATETSKSSSKPERWNRNLHQVKNAPILRQYVSVDSSTETSQIKEYSLKTYSKSVYYLQGTALADFISSHALHKSNENLFDEMSKYENIASRRNQYAFSNEGKFFLEAILLMHKNRVIPCTKPSEKGISIDSLADFFNSIRHEYSNIDAKTEKLEKFLFLINAENIFHVTFTQKVFHHLSNSLISLKSLSCQGFQYALLAIDQIQDCPFCCLKEKMLQLYVPSLLVSESSNCFTLNRPPSVSQKLDELRQIVDSTHTMMDRFMYELLKIYDCFFDKIIPDASATETPILENTMSTCADVTMSELNSSLKFVLNYISSQNDLDVPDERQCLTKATEEAVKSIIDFMAIDETILASEVELIKNDASRKFADSLQNSNYNESLQLEKDSMSLLSHILSIQGKIEDSVCERARVITNILNDKLNLPEFSKSDSNDSSRITTDESTSRNVNRALKSQLFKIIEDCRDNLILQMNMRLHDRILKDALPEENKRKYPKMIQLYRQTLEYILFETELESTLSSISTDGLSHSLNLSGEICNLLDNINIQDPRKIVPREKSIQQYNLNELHIISSIVGMLIPDPHNQDKIKFEQTFYSFQTELDNSTISDDIKKMMNDYLITNTAIIGSENSFKQKADILKQYLVLNSKHKPKANIHCTDATNEESQPSIKGDSKEPKKGTIADNIIQMMCKCLLLSNNKLSDSNSSCCNTESEIPVSLNHAENIDDSDIVMSHFLQITKSRSLLELFCMIEQKIRILDFNQCRSKMSGLKAEVLQNIQREYSSNKQLVSWSVFYEPDLKRTKQSNHDQKLPSILGSDLLDFLVSYTLFCPRDQGYGEIHDSFFDDLYKEFGAQHYLNYILKRSGGK